MNGDGRTSLEGRGGAAGHPPPATRRARRLTTVTAAAATAALVLAGCGFLGDDGPSATGHLVALGDSITHQSSDDLEERFADRDDDLTVEAHPGHTAEEVLGQAPRVVDELGDTEALQVIVNVGTNDVIKRLDPTDTLEGVTAMVDLFPGARCVHVVTISRRILVFDDPDLGDRIDELNGLIEGLADERPEVRVLDWNEVLDDPPGDLEAGDLLAGDTVHANPVGQAILADAYVAAFDDCA